MKAFFSICLFLVSSIIFAQENQPTDFLSSEFHKERRQALREKMPPNSVAVFFANAVRNRANDVDYVYHQDPNFYYLTGYREPHAVLLVFSEEQSDENGNSFNEMIYVQPKNEFAEMWTGRRLGAEGTKSKLGFEQAFNNSEFLENKINFKGFDKVMLKPFQNDYRNTRDESDLFDLISHFKNQTGYEMAITKETSEDKNVNIEINQGREVKPETANIDTKILNQYMAELRQVKTEEELKLLTKAVRISAQGQREIMKAMHPGMSETEIQGIHEYVYKKYGSEYEGYPSIVGAGENGCVLHYIDNSKTKVENDLVLMDLGAEYHGYTADVTRTIPANGKFSPEQKKIYDLVYKAQEAGIKACQVGNEISATNVATKKIINEGLVELGIIDSVNAKHMYFPHGTSHHIGLDVHDPGVYGKFEPNMVLTVEPGIYIPEGSPCDEKWWGIAVRIEDDILITENGPINLSGEAPRKSEEIEALMKQDSPLSNYKLPELD
ncbi:aminopeptidase P N-terminal domain-containing protein [Gramella sp. GC03-9]|uniref:Xaa-Pro aminopeptidase n=1 Tax=Christiangramia oceanisediminis TaxID=2920386 RepID=A0A9X2KWL2_9FLAO|nr:aminopeptidase P N-terminal domain-containing protein [Gramella oceanisediminis]MCP9199588.1 aminopeptidase P N-terminal domain-containing protein [Gramella oceanisediminis]